MILFHPGIITFLKSFAYINQLILLFTYLKTFIRRQGRKISAQHRLFFPIFYLMFPNIKKVKILTPIISNETMQSKVYTTITSPSVLCDWQKIEWHVPGWKISPVYKKKKKKNHQQPSNKHASQLLLCVYKLLYKLFKLGGTQHFSCPNLSCCPAESTGDSPNTLQASEHWDSRHYLLSTVGSALESAEVGFFS